MIITQLRLTNVRAFREAEFNFHPGMNLLVGINGVGKSTVLDAIRITLSQMMPNISNSKESPTQFTNEHITVGEVFFFIFLNCELNQKMFGYSSSNLQKFTKPKNKEQRLYKKHYKNFAHIYNWYIPYLNIHAETLNQTITGELAKYKELNSLAIYFSPHRSVLASTKPNIRNNNALAPRQFNLQEFIDWWLAYEKLAKEGLASGQTILAALAKTVSEFLSCSNLHADEKKKTLLIDKSGVTLDIKQLSDGERGLLALVLDLTRRLALANPYLDNPAKEGKAVVLIDELDLHLHPKWQRTIVHQLTRTFPNCQFIATTHSPQIISEVQPESLTFLVREGDEVVVRPATQAYGLDTNWILDHLMDVPSRPEPTQDLIDQIENLIQEGELELARKTLSQLRQILHGADGEVIRLEANIDTLEAFRNEVDSEEE